MEKAKPEVCTLETNKDTVGRNFFCFNKYTYKSFKLKF